MYEIKSHSRAGYWIWSGLGPEPLTGTTFGPSPDPIMKGAGSGMYSLYPQVKGRVFTAMTHTLPIPGRPVPSPGGIRYI